MTMHEMANRRVFMARAVFNVFGASPLVGQTV